MYTCFHSKPFLQLDLTPYTPAIDGDGCPIDVTRRSARQEHDRSRNILRLSESSRGNRSRDLVSASRGLHEPVRHLRGKEARRDAVHADVPRAQLDGKIASQMDDGGFRGGVAVRALLADGADADACDRGRDDDARRRPERRSLLEERCKSARRSA